MRALLEVMQFEIRYQLRSPFFLGALLMFALIHFLAITGTVIHIDTQQPGRHQQRVCHPADRAGALHLRHAAHRGLCHDRDHARFRTRDRLARVRHADLAQNFCAGKISRGAEPCAFDRSRRTAGRDDRHLHAVAGSGAHCFLLAAALGVHLLLSSSCPAHSSYAPSSSASRRSPAPLR